MLIKLYMIGNQMEFVTKKSFSFEYLTNLFNQQGFVFLDQQSVKGLKVVKADGKQSAFNLTDEHL